MLITEIVDASYSLKARAAGGEACLCFLYKQHKPEHTQKVNNEQEHFLIAVLYETAKPTLFK